MNVQVSRLLAPALATVLIVCQNPFHGYPAIAQSVIDPATNTIVPGNRQLLRSFPDPNRRFGPADIPQFEQLLEQARAMQDRYSEAVALAMLMQIYGQQDDDYGLRYLQRQLSLVERSGNRLSLGVVSELLGMVYNTNGKPDAAIEALNTAVAVARETRDIRWEAVVLGRLGETYSQQGNWAQAVASFQQRLAIVKNLPQNSFPQVSEVLIELAEAYQNQGNSQQAIATYEEAIATARGDILAVYQRDALQKLAYLYAAQGNTGKAVELFQSTLQFPDEDAAAYRGNSLEALSRLAALKGNYTEAITLQKQALATFETLPPSPELPADPTLVATNGYSTIALARLGILQQQNGQMREAEATLRAAIASNRVVRRTLLKDISQSSYREAGERELDDMNQGLRYTLDDAYWTLQQILVARGQVEEALAIAEESRARAFADLLAARLAKRADTDPSAINLATVEAQSLSLDQMRQVAKTRNTTLVQYSLLYNDLSYDPLQLSHKQRQAMQLLIWVIQPGGRVHFRSVDLKAVLPKTSLTDLVNATRLSIGAGNRGFSFNENSQLASRTGGANTPARSSNQYLQQLHQVLIQPVADLLPAESGASVTFIPQEALFLVPFAALQDAKGKFLIDQYGILSAPSIQTLAFTAAQRQRLRASGKQGGQKLVVGNPTMPKLRFSPDSPPKQLTNLPGAEQEAQRVANLLKTQPLIGAQATEPAVVQQMAQASLIHLATHGLLDDSQNFQSSLALAPTDEADGFLDVSEIYRLKLNADLVVLSACDTGRGYVNSDGVIGLSRAFIAAGTPSIIVSLWKVPDAPTAALMTEFYRQLQKGHNKAQALRQAMLLTKADYPNPLDWAAFTLIGEAD